MGVFSEAVAGKKRAFPTTGRESTSCRCFDRALVLCAPRTFFLFLFGPHHPPTAVFSSGALHLGKGQNSNHHLIYREMPLRPGRGLKNSGGSTARVCCSATISSFNRCRVCSGQRSSHRQLVIAFDRQASPEIAQIISSAAPRSSRPPRMSSVQPADLSPAVLAAVSFPRFHWLP
uniref:Uncharacterized protein n=1 Tax=Rhipicephalus zambeziensis TaxID=60191 RepID=A0A224YI39_9ACAR